MGGRVITLSSCSFIYSAIGHCAPSLPDSALPKIAIAFLREGLAADYAKTADLAKEVADLILEKGQCADLELDVMLLIRDILSPADHEMVHFEDMWFLKSHIVKRVIE